MTSSSTARVTVTVTGLLDAPHAMHIAVDGSGRCPTYRQSSIVHGHRAIDFTHGIPEYGLPGAALTIWGSTNPVHTFDLNRYPQVGTFQYRRSIHLTNDMRLNLSSRHAVVVVVGIDWNDNGRYDGVLGYQRLAPALTSESTAPALCGVLPAPQP